MSVGSGSSGAEEAGPPTGRTGQTREAVEPETVLVGRYPPGAGVLQRREQHGQNFQLSGGAPAFLCASENLTAVLLSVYEQLSNLHRSSCRRALSETEPMRRRLFSNATMPLRSCLARRMTRLVFYLCSFVQGSRTLASIHKRHIWGILFMLYPCRDQKKGCFVIPSCWTWTDVKTCLS